MEPDIESASKNLMVSISMMNLSPVFYSCNLVFPLLRYLSIGYSMNALFCNVIAL